MKNVGLLSGLVWLLVLLAAAMGVFYDTSEPSVEHVTVRGEKATFQGSGLYRYDPAEVAKEGIVWDAVNLIVGLPLFAFAIYLAARKSLRGQLLLGGMLFYFFYNYLMYATMVAFNPLFLVYIAIFALSLVTFLLNLRTIDVARLPERISNRFPRRVIVGYSFAMATIIFLLWLKLILSMMRTDRFPPEFAGMTTLQTQALDLGLVLPLLVSTAILLLRRSPLGYLLAGISISFGLMMSIVLPAWIAVPLIEQGKINLIEAVPFLGGCLVGLLLAGWFFKSVGKGSEGEVVPAVRA